MEQQEREYFVSRICAGFIKLRVPNYNGDFLFFQSPSLQQRYLAEEVYQEIYLLAQDHQNFDETDLNTFLFEYNLWSEQEENKLKGIYQDLEKLKVGALDLIFKPEEMVKTKKYIGKAKEEISRLEAKKSAYNFLSCEGIASIARSKFLVGTSLRYNKNKKVFLNKRDFWRSDTPLLAEAMEEFLRNKLTESQMRELARNDPWRNLWLIRDCEQKLFSDSVLNYTDEQRSLVMWSKFYDNVYEHPERPISYIINDDDFLDGWVILQKRKRDKDENMKGADDLIKNEKIKNAQNIFIQTDPLGAKAVDDLNDPIAKGIKAARNKKLFSQGVVNELDMPDTRRRLEMEVVNKTHEAIKRRG